MKCTWEDCDEEEVIELRDVYGMPWAHLCKKHNKEFESLLSTEKAENICKAWILARGGADELAEDISMMFTQRSFRSKKGIFGSKK
jgi:hypothetical protein